MKINSGEGGLIVYPGSMVKIHFTGKLSDGTIFESTYQNGEPLMFKVGDGKVIKGLDEGVTQLCKGQRAIFTVPPELGYGDKGRVGVPPDSTLIYAVEIIDFE